MNNIKLYFSKHLNLFAIIVIIILAIPAYSNLIKPGYFSMHDDIQIMRLFEMKKCFQDGQVPCRWVPDMGAGYGHPLYNYHQVFPYYLGMGFKIVGISYIDTAKALFLLSLVLSGIFMYYLTKEFFGKVSGILGAVFYIYAPYHSVDIYVRGALTESWGITFFPLIFISLYKFIKEGSNFWFVSSIISILFLFLSHNIMAMLFIPIAIIWSLFWMVLNKNWSKLFLIIIIFIWALGLASFFVLPAFFEQSLVKIESLTTGYYSFRDHFITFNQLFINRDFGYGPSIAGPNDTLSFQIGWPHWWLLIIGTVIVLLRFNKRNKIWWASVFSIFVASFGTFMTQSESLFIWNIIPISSFVQFPWRLLGLIIFACSFIASGVIFAFNRKMKYFIATLLITATILLNANYFQPQIFYPTLTDKEKLSDNNWRIQSMATLVDYVPSQLIDYPTDLAPNVPQIVDNNGKILRFENHSNTWNFEIDVDKSQKAKVLVPVFNFPEWEVLMDNKKIEFTDKNSLGLIQVNIPEGKHIITGKFNNTPLRTVSNILSLISGIALLAFVLTKMFYINKGKKYK